MKWYFVTRRNRQLAVLAIVSFAGIFGLSATAAVEPARGRVDDAVLLREQLIALSPAVGRTEADRLARAAHRRAHQLKREYRAAGAPQFHNFLVNAGIKERGLCHHWARDLGAQLTSLKLRTLVLRWGIARGGTLREHNAVVVTARGQPFHDGIVLDAWRHSGRLYSAPVSADKYPWKEDRNEMFIARAATVP